jgi:hypothetical protein
VIAGISTFSVTRQVLEGSTIIDETPLEPNMSLVAVLVDVPKGRQFVLSLVGNPSDVPLEARITGPDGSIMTLYNITSTPFTATATTESSGNHTLEVKNVGSRAVTVSGGVLNSRIGHEDNGASMQDNPSVQNLVAYGIGILVGAALIVAGIVLLIIGAIKYLRGRRAPPNATP